MKYGSLFRILNRLVLQLFKSELLVEVRDEMNKAHLLIASIDSSILCTSSVNDIIHEMTELEEVLDDQLTSFILQDLTYRRV